ncbi:hypothetical protein, partial [Thiocystis violacea]|uniref:hypothetical protein n=1 Tax=Thiocystis violacea TaxID=13725 RepID=UPI001A928402
MLVGHETHRTTDLEERLERPRETGGNGTKISLSIFKNKQLQPLMRFAESVSSALFLRVAMVTDLFLC